MVEPVGFIEAWKAQFPESDPPKMELRSVGDIEQELEKCKASIRRLEQEVNKERFRMIYLQTLLAKERKSYDKQRWGFRKTPLNEGLDSAAAQGAESLSQQPHMQETGSGDKGRYQPLPDVSNRSKCRPPPARKSASHGENLESAFEVPQQAEFMSCDNVDGLSPSKQRGCITVSPRRPTLPPPDKDLSSDPKDKIGMGLGVAALRSNFERIKWANSQSGDIAAKSQEKPLPPPPPPPFYSNMEFHRDRALVRVSDRDVSEKISTLGSQAMQMERKRSLHSLPGNLATVAGELRARPVYRGRSTESTCGYEAEYEDGEPTQRHSGRANGSKPPPLPWQPSEFQAFSSVYVGGVMMGEGGGGGDGRGGGGTGCSDDHLLTWPRRSYSPGSFEDVGVGGGGGGYTPDCSSNENLTSSEEDFSSGQSSHVSPSPTTGFHRPFREKSRSPSQNSQNSQHSFDSSSPPTPQSQKRHQRQQGGHVVMSEATIVSVRKTGQIWPPPSHHDLLPYGRTSHDNIFHGDHLGESCFSEQVG